MTIPNRPRLADLVTMPVGAVTALPAETLALLQEEADEALRAAKTVKDWLDGTLALKYGSLADQDRAVAGKDTGSVRFADGPVTIVADLPKRVEWDQSRLAALVERITANVQAVRSAETHTAVSASAPSGNAAAANASAVAAQAYRQASENAAVQSEQAQTAPVSAKAVTAQTAI
uniref:Uncharacterized protein n=1 Tax=Magnetospirillum gryphiswaldense TaxID=55518 RepID=A4U447_9PROT|nr:conserved hypothetical protein [Magnetospirillum gryphiswaldense MSR-1]